MSTLRPLGDRYIIEPLESPDIINGVIVPEIAKTPPNKGTVVEVGKAVEKDGIQRGDMVLFSAYAATPIPFEGKNFLIVRKHDLIAIL